SSHMKGKRVLVTGAGTGIGRGIALAFARHGAAVAVHYSHSSAGAEAVVKEIVDGGGKAAAFQADFGEVAPLQRMTSAAVAFLGGLDVLVNNAGITMNRPFGKVTVEQFDLLYHVNVRAPFFLTQALLPELENSHGVVINLSSIHAYEGYTEHSVYAGTRGAIVAFTRQLAIELAPHGVRVNAIAPGAVPVPNHFKSSPGVDVEQAIRDCGRGIPCGFAGKPDDIANVALFLASDASRYIVAQTLVVDGGTTSWMPFGEQFKQLMTAQFGQGYVPGL
ncbi:MAG TPA: glucose 1-dehydrogenase, partial [Phycisphaerae bacterium]|nr:glucose 1-dehydrogenase [Phycisphaerae bacterium]